MQCRPNCRPVGRKQSNYSVWRKKLCTGRPPLSCSSLTTSAIRLLIAFGEQRPGKRSHVTKCVTVGCVTESLSDV